MNCEKTVVLRFVFFATTVVAHLGLSNGAIAGSVSAARSLPPDSNATIDDLILTRVVDFTVSDDNHVIYGQDASGGVAIIVNTANMAAFLAGPDAISGNTDDVVPGSRIDISGTTTSFNGIFQIGEIPFPQNWLYDGLFGIPSAIDLNITDMQDGSLLAESYEGMLVRLKGVSFTESGIFASASNYAVTDGTLNATVRVSTSTMPVAGTTIPTGVVDVVGILSQFDSTDPQDSNYQLLVSFQTDIAQVPEPSSIYLLFAAVSVVHQPK